MIAIEAMEAALSEVAVPSRSLTFGGQSSTRASSALDLLKHAILQINWI